MKEPPGVSPSAEKGPHLKERSGTMTFLDAGTAYDHGAHFSDQHLRKGVGAGVWLIAALFQLNLSVAHGLGAGTRVHFGAGLTF